MFTTHDLTDEQKSNIRKWVEALESGDYKQTKYVLRDNDGYCCLGVLCTILGIPNSYDSGLQCYFFFNKSESVKQGKCDELPSDVGKMTGLTGCGLLPTPIPYTGKTCNGHHYSLAELNDARYTFKEIAAIIREQWLGE